ncbi:hypothetical protein ACVBKF_07670 [Shewanella sp. 0m-11]
MDKIEYKAMKKLAMAQLGANDAESLIYYAEKLEKSSNIYKWGSIILGVISLPLCFLLIGIPMLFMSIVMYFFLYRKTLKKALMFKEYVNNDSELSTS